MARSMTGFGRAEMMDEALHLSVEIKSVNNRYLDFNFRMPRKMNCFEAKIRSLLSGQIKRGKVDVFISCYDQSQAAAGVRFNEELAAKYLSFYKTIASMDGVNGPILPSDIARCPEVFQIEDASLDEDTVYAALEPVLKEALAQFIAARETEGERLKEDILGKLDILAEGAREVAAHEPEIIEAYREKLLEKMTELLQDKQVEESRLLTEAALFADRISTDEEQVRLLAHIGKMRDVLRSEGSIGRNLDFLTQEMNREANTMLSKAGDLVTADTALLLKTQIEKIREQIQNIE